MDRNRIVPAHTVDTTVDNRGHAHRGHSGVGLNTPVDTVVDGQESPTDESEPNRKTITVLTILHPGDLVAVRTISNPATPARCDLAIDRIDAVAIPDPDHDDGDDYHTRYFINNVGWCNWYEVSDDGVECTVCATVPTPRLFAALHALFDNWGHQIGEFDVIRKWLTPEQQETLVVILAKYGRFFTPEDMAS